MSVQHHINQTFQSSLMMHFKRFILLFWGRSPLMEKPVRQQVKKRTHVKNVPLFVAYFRLLISSLNDKWPNGTLRCFKWLVSLLLLSSQEGCFVPQSAGLEMKWDQSWKVKWWYWKSKRGTLWCFFRTDERLYTSLFVLCRAHPLITSLWPCLIPEVVEDFQTQKQKVNENRKTCSNRPSISC